MSKVLLLLLWLSTVVGCGDKKIKPPPLNSYRDIYQSVYQVSKGKWGFAVNVYENQGYCCPPPRYLYSDTIIGSFDFIQRHKGNVYQKAKNYIDSVQLVIKLYQDTINMIKNQSP